jgi:hypothetical protein
MKITISQGLGWRKTLLERHNELVGLRSQNSVRETRFYGANVDKERIVEPLYDVVALDNLITRLAREIRDLDEKIKDTNTKTEVAGYDRKEEVLGELVAASPAKETKKK